MRFEKSKQLYSYWLNLKGDRTAPERSEIEPSDIRQLLGDTFILEINHEAKYIVYRLAGTRLCSAYGRELKGLGYLVHWHEEDNVEILANLNDVYVNFIPSVISHHGFTAQNRFMDYETLLLPLQPIHDGTTRILGLSSPHSTAFWHGVEPVVTHKLRSIRQIGSEVPATEKLSVVNTAPPLYHQGINEADTLSDPHEKNSTHRKVAHLTVYEGGKS